jgi:hypothetical protein
MAGDSAVAGSAPMPRVIRAKTGRLVLLLLVVAGFLLAFAFEGFAGRNGAVSSEVSLNVTQRLLKLYLPLFGLVSAFYFSERAQTVERNPLTTPLEGFGFACVVVGIWAGLPALLFVTQDTFESVLRILDSFDVFGSTIAITALAYYFSVSARAVKT